jgi:hypothetical protein
VTGEWIPPSLDGRVCAYEYYIPDTISGGGRILLLRCIIPYEIVIVLPLYQVAVSRIVWVRLVTPIFTASGTSDPAGDGMDRGPLSCRCYKFRDLRHLSPSYTTALKWTI